MPIVLNWSNRTSEHKFVCYQFFIALKSARYVRLRKMQCDNKLNLALIFHASMNLWIHTRTRPQPLTTQSGCVQFAFHHQRCRKIFLSTHFDPLILDLLSDLCSHLYHDFLMMNFEYFKSAKTFQSFKFSVNKASHKRIGNDYNVVWKALSHRFTCLQATLKKWEWPWIFQLESKSLPILQLHQNT